MQCATRAPASIKPRFVWWALQGQRCFPANKDTTDIQLTESFWLKSFFSRSSSASLCSVSICRLHLPHPRPRCGVPIGYAILSWRVLCAALSQPAEQRCSCARLPAPAGWKGCGLGCQQCIPQLTFALSAPSVILQIMQRSHLRPAGEGKPQCWKGQRFIHGFMEESPQKLYVVWWNTLKPAHIPCGRDVFQSLPLNKISAGKADEIPSLRSTCRARLVFSKALQDEWHSKAGQPVNTIICLFTQKLPPVPCRALKPELHWGLCVLVWARSMAQGAPDLVERQLLWLISWKQNELYIFKARLYFKN